mmetsp:Transcript_26593/g.72195  ORF Transcript_26593/g.72195 Transcript_26593/m.72195 type:complete len:81 (-) Transcript_26593:154-396(-)
MQIIVKQMTGETLKCEVQASTTGADLRKMIRDGMHVPEEQQKLTYDGKAIEDATKVGDVGVKEEDTVNLWILSWTETRGL